MKRSLYFLASLLFMSTALCSCEDELDMEAGNITQLELNREKYAGVPEEFCSGKISDWEKTLWGNGVGIITEKFTCFNLKFPKCKNLFATVPMYKNVEVTANGVECYITDMLADKQGEDIFLTSVRIEDRYTSAAVSAESLNAEAGFAFGRYEKIDASSIRFTFPVNPYFFERSFTLTISYSKTYPLPSSPSQDSYVPEFKIFFKQLGNNNHLSTIQ